MLLDEAVSVDVEVLVDGVQLLQSEVVELANGMLQVSDIYLILLLGIDDRIQFFLVDLSPLQRLRQLE